MVFYPRKAGKFFPFPNGAPLKAHHETPILDREGMAGVFHKNNRDFPIE
jgi:hypothetical protein